MKRMNVFLSLLIILAMLLAVFFTARPTANALAARGIEDAGTAWYSASWHYRRPVVITNNGSTDLTNYQVLITLTTTNFDFSQANSDGSDLRVTNSSGLILLPFWIESWTSTLAYVWVKVPSILASTPTTLYLYFGNTSAVSAGDGTQTFDLFEDIWHICTGGIGTCNPVHRAGQSWWESAASYPMVFEDTSFSGRPRYHMLYDGHNVIGNAKGYAYSSDLVNWTESASNPIMGTGYAGGGPYAWGDTVKVGGIYYMFASAGPGATQRVESTDLTTWTNFTTLTEDDPGGNIGTGAAILKEGDGITPVMVDGRYWMVYFHGDSAGTMYMASSTDLLYWEYASSFSLPPTAGGWDQGGLWTPSFARIDGNYYIYYQGDALISGDQWETGYATAAAYSGVTPLRPDSTTWTKSATPVITRDTGSWDSTYVIDPMIRKFSNGIYYVFYTGDTANGYATATSPTGPWTKLPTTIHWATTGTVTSPGGILTMPSGRRVQSSTTYLHQAIGFRANYPTGGSATDLVWGGFINGSAAPFTLISTRRSLSNLYLRNYYGSETTADLGSTWYSNYHVYELRWTSTQTMGIVDHSTSASLLTTIPVASLPANLANFENSGTFYVDWVYVRQYSNPEPTAVVNTEDTCMPAMVYVDDDYTIGTVGTHIWNCDAFSSIQTALDTANTATTVNVAAGTYAESVTLSRAAAVFVNGDITLNGSLTLNAGTFTAPAGALSLSGNFTHSGGTFTHNSGTVVFAGAGTQNLTLSSATTFNNLTVNAGVLLSETVSTDNATVAGTLANSGTIRKFQSVAATGIQTFGLTGVTIDVRDLTGADPLTGLLVDRIDQNNTHGTGDPGYGTNTGRYWTITPTGTNYMVYLTLPHNLARPELTSVCRYDGLIGYGWSCVCTAYSANTVTRNDITQLSDWAVGYSAGPTAVKLSKLTASTTREKALGVAATAGLVIVLVTAVFLWRRRTRTQP